MTEIQIIRGEITERHDDAIVNAANEALPAGWRSERRYPPRGWPLFYACRELGGWEPGDAKVSAAYDLPAKYVIDTVGPVWDGGEAGEDELLARCYQRSLAVAQDHNLRSIAFPSISTGVYEFPVERAARIALYAIRDVLDQQATTSIDRVTIVCFDDVTYESFRAAAAQVV